MKHFILLLATLVLSGLSLRAWSHCGPLGFAHFLAAAVMYVAAPQVILWGVRETLKDLRRP